MTIQGNYGDEKITSSVQTANPLGTRMELPDGRAFYYAQAAGTALAAGAITQGAATVTAHDMDLVVTAAAAIGARTIAVTLGATLSAKDQYKDGYVYVNDGAGEGHIYKIAGNNAVAASGGMTIQLYQTDVVREALTTSSLVGLVVNPYKDVIVYPASVTGQAVGVPATEIAADAFGWLQTAGPASVLCDVASVVGNHVRVSDNTAGATEPLVRGATDENDEAIGVAMLIAPVSGDYGLVDLRIRT
jgi:hypothetical protein